jgi:FixJ family two-component response regulator
MLDEIEDDDEQFFAEELRAKQHKEQMGVLKGIATSLNKPQDNGVVDAIKESVRATAGLVDAVKNMPKPEKPEVNIEFNAREIVSSLQAICDKIVDSNNKVVAALENKQLVDEFKISQDNWGKINTVKVVYTPANKITYSKSKYQA